VDVTATWETKIQAILEHKSQISDPEALIERMHKRGAVKDSSEENPRYEEHFRVIRWRQ
jgi:LmbE family N-acetylglucosaminyl deacetylase